MVRSLQVALVLLLALLVSGLPALARAVPGCDDGCDEEQTADPAGNHSEEEEDGGCCQGSPVCVNCGCCPARSGAPTSPTAGLFSFPRPTRQLLAASAAPVLAELGSDIFHPPRS